MSLSVNRINFTGNTEQPRPSQVTTAGGSANTKLLKACAPKDSVCFKANEKEENVLTDDTKKEMVRAARTKAAGCACLWSLIGLGWTSLLYYGLRSDETVAKKHLLDPVEDKKLVKQIKNQQMLWTIPACIPFVGAVPGIVAWLYNKNMDADKIEL